MKFDDLDKKLYNILEGFLTYDSSDSVPKVSPNENYSFDYFFNEILQQGNFNIFGEGLLDLLNSKGYLNIVDVEGKKKINGESLIMFLTTHGSIKREIVREDLELIVTKNEITIEDEDELVFGLNYDTEKDNIEEKKERENYQEESIQTSPQEDKKTGYSIQNTQIREEILEEKLNITSLPENLEELDNDTFYRFKDILTISDVGEQTIRNRLNKIKGDELTRYIGLVKKDSNNGYLKGIKGSIIEELITRNKGVRSPSPFKKTIFDGEEIPKELNDIQEGTMYDYRSIKEKSEVGNAGIRDRLSTFKGMYPDKYVKLVKESEKGRIINIDGELAKTLMKPKVRGRKKSNFEVNSHEIYDMCVIQKSLTSHLSSRDIKDFVERFESGNSNLAKRGQNGQITGVSGVIVSKLLEYKNLDLVKLKKNYDSWKFNETIKGTDVESSESQTLPPINNIRKKEVMTSNIEEYLRTRLTFEKVADIPIIDKDRLYTRKDFSEIVLRKSSVNTTDEINKMISNNLIQTETKQGGSRELITGISIMKLIGDFAQVGDGENFEVDSILEPTIFGTGAPKGYVSLYDLQEYGLDVIDIRKAIKDLKINVNVYSQEPCLRHSDMEIIKNHFSELGRI